MSVIQDSTPNVETVPPSQAVVERVAACEGIDQLELMPLFKAIDPDALDRLVETSRHNDSTLRITFTYHGHDVTVTSDGVVHLASEEAIDG
jgi:hypothetical protein